MSKKDKKAKEETKADSEHETYLSKLFYTVFGRLYKPRFKIKKMVIKQTGKPSVPPY